LELKETTREKEAQIRSEISKKMKEKKKKILTLKKKEEEEKKILKGNISLYSTFINQINLKKKYKKQKLEKKEKKRLQKHYNVVLNKPQRYLEIFWISFYTPLFFIGVFATSLLMGLYMDSIIPKNDLTLIMIMLPFLCITIPLFFLSFLAVFLSELFRSLRWRMKLDSLMVLFYIGALWIPILTFLICLKYFLLPDWIAWRVVFSPFWVICFVYTVSTFIVHHFFKVKFEKEQKIVWFFNTAINLAICIAAGFMSAKLDESLSISFGVANFILAPIYILLFFGIVVVSILGYYFLYSKGWKKTFLFYFPTIFMFIIPFIPFFILLGIFILFLIKKVNFNNKKKKVNF
jgi:MFS family permease